MTPVEEPMPDNDPAWTTWRIAVACAIAIVVSFALAGLVEWLR